MELCSLKDRRVERVLSLGLILLRDHLEERILGHPVRDILGISAWMGAHVMSMPGLFVRPCTPRVGAAFVLCCLLRALTESSLPASVLMGGAVDSGAASCQQVISL